MSEKHKYTSQSVRERGTELLRVRTDFPDFSPLCVPDKISEFYDRVAESAASGAVRRLDADVRSEFYGSSFFRRLNCDYKAQVSFLDETFLSVTLDVSVTRAGKRLFFLRKAQIWLLCGEYILPPRRYADFLLSPEASKKEKREIAETAKSFDGAYLDGDFTVFFRNAGASNDYIEKLISRK
ncbi:MAG: hypothetical protein ACI4QZ_03625 [Eubacteriales bacterium]